jgi:ABC-type dipeptide/oligopeptide/nickel transport system permease subunit
MGYAILNAAGLSFIGLGIIRPTPEWGIMVAGGASNIISGEWWIAVPWSRTDAHGLLLQSVGRRLA